MVMCVFIVLVLPLSICSWDAIVIAVNERVAIRYLRQILRTNAGNKAHLVPVYQSSRLRNKMYHLEM